MLPAVQSHPDFAMVRAVVNSRVPYHLREEAILNGFLAVLEAERKGVSKQTVVRRRTIDFLRTECGRASRGPRPTRGEMPADVASTAPSPETVLIRAEIPPRLERRQIAVMRGLALGETSKDIAHRLQISPKTVDAYVYQLFTIFNVHTRLELASIAWRKKYVVDPDTQTAMGQGLAELQKRVRALERAAEYFRRYLRTGRG